MPRWIEGESDNEYLDAEIKRASTYSMSSKRNAEVATKSKENFRSQVSAAHMFLLAFSFSSHPAKLICSKKSINSRAGLRKERPFFPCVGQIWHQNYLKTGIQSVRWQK